MTNQVKNKRHKIITTLSSWGYDLIDESNTTLTFMRYGDKKKVSILKTIKHKDLMKGSLWVIIDEDNIKDNKIKGCPVCSNKIRQVNNSNLFYCSKCIKSFELINEEER